VLFKICKWGTAANRLKENNQTISASRCAACQERKTKEQSTPQGKKNKQNNCGKSLQVGKSNNHVWPVAAASKEKNKTMVACQKKNQSTWPLELQGKNQPVSQEVRLQEWGKNNLTASKQTLIYLCMQPQAEKNFSASQGNQQSSCVACSEARNNKRTIHLCGTSKKNKNGNKSTQAEKTKQATCVVCCSCKQTNTNMTTC